MERSAAAEDSMSATHTTFLPATVNSFPIDLVNESNSATCATCSPVTSAVQTIAEATNQKLIQNAVQICLSKLLQQRCLEYSSTNMYNARVF